ncbi:hypothetical protein [uncultured phage cr2_1]|uniref:BACON domain-containing protein n=1 Tax=uncultured phage cr2_1 TaxID=2986394 RepID=A0AAE7RW11_9CAUD|nr:hypothetical protein M1M57_gp74 [uncultured phage cr2_1]QWM90456.1 hypothetical protein [uncultured phage cr2_1]
MDKAFITVTPDTGQNNGTLSVNADKNENYVSRYATFKVEGGGITKSVSIEQNPNPYIYIDCGYIFSNANIQEPYKLTQEGAVTVLMFDVKFANFILSSRHLFIIKNVSSLQVEFNDPVISSINLTSDGQSFGYITLNGFTTKIIPNSEDEGTVLSIIDITPAKLNEIVANINSARDASTTGKIAIAIFIKTTGTQDNLLILINVI